MWMYNCQMRNRSSPMCPQSMMPFPRSQRGEKASWHKYVQWSSTHTFNTCTVLCFSYIYSVLILRRLTSDGQSTSLISPPCFSGRGSTRLSWPTRTSLRTLWSSRYVGIFLFCFFIRLNETDEFQTSKRLNWRLKILWSRLNYNGYLRDRSACK